MTDKESMHTIKVPLDEFVREIARDAAREVIREHVESCKINQVDTRVKALEKKWTYSRGFVAGIMALGGILGGVAGFLLGSWKHLREIF